jgi:hypothetical protein
MQFHNQTMLESVQSKSSAFYQRRIIVQDGLIDITTLSGQQSSGFHYPGLGSCVDFNSPQGMLPESDAVALDFD